MPILRKKKKVEPVEPEVEESQEETVEVTVEAPQEADPRGVVMGL